MHLCLYRWLFVTLALILGTLPLHAIKTLAGTVITNQAKMVYFNPDYKVAKIVYIFSNVSTIKVKKQFSFELDSGLTNERKVSLGQVVNYSHRIRNTGNVKSSFQIKLLPINGIENFKAHQVVIDTNGDGVANDNEPTLSPIACVPATSVGRCYSLEGLDPGDIHEFVITSLVPDTLTNKDKIAYKVAVSVVESPSLIKYVANRAVVILGANLVVNKSVTPSCGSLIKPNEAVSFSINFTNIGEEKPETKQYIIDDLEVEGALLEDRILSNFTLQKSPIPTFAPFDGVLVVQTTTFDNTKKWITFDKWDGSELLAKIGLFIKLDQLLPNQSGQLTFELTSPANPTEGLLTNIAGFNYDPNSSFEFASNSACVVLAKNSLFGEKALKATVRFLKPSVVNQQSDKTPNFNTSTDFEDAFYYRVDRGLSARNSTQYFIDRDGVYIELHSNALNLKPDVIDSAIINLKSSTGDTLRVKVQETGENTANFKSLKVIRVNHSLRGSNALCGGSYSQGDYSTIDPLCKLKGEYNGLITASIFDPGLGSVISTTALLDPVGKVFDAALRTPIKGAKVFIKIPNDTLTPDDDDLAIDPFSGKPYEAIITGSEGRYLIPPLAAGNYYLSVKGPKGYKDTSLLPPDMFINFNVNDFSYGKDGFTKTTNVGVFQLSTLRSIDIPLDPKNHTVFELNKTTSATQVGIGEMITYKVEIKNYLEKNLYAIVLDDHIPYGFRYVKGTTFLNGKKIPDPLGVPGPYLRFQGLPFKEGRTKGQINGDESHILSYTLRATAGAIDSDGLNSISGSGVTDTSYKLDSNTSKATVKIVQNGVLGDGAIIIGKVFVDANCDQKQSNGEWPIGGVKIYMEDGTWVITDGNGQYSLYGVKPGNHILKVDSISLPEGVKLKPIDNRHMADPGSRLVDLKGGDFYRADFAAMCPKDESPYVFDQLKIRNAGHSDWMLENAVKYESPSTKKIIASDGDISSGTINSKSKTRANVSTGPMITRGFSIQLAQFEEGKKAELFQQKLPNSLRLQSFIYKFGDFNTVRVGFALRKSVMRKLLKDYANTYKKARIVTTIYERLSDADLDKLEGPTNVHRMPKPQELIKTVTKAQAKKGQFIWPRGEMSLDGRFIAVIRQGILPTLMVNDVKIPSSQIGERIINKREKAQVVAWYGVELLPGINNLKVIGKDPFGNVRDLAKGRFKRPSKPVVLKLQAMTRKLPADGGRSYIPVKIQVLDENGYPARGVNFITLESSEGSWVERDIQTVVPGKQVRVINGERIVHFRSSDKTGKVKLKAMDGDLLAEDYIFQIAYMRPLLAAGIVTLGGRQNKFDNVANVPNTLLEKDIDGRTAFFVKGKVVGNMHLTLSYDSEKETGEERFRDTNSSKYYSLLGDDSQRGYEAQSRSPLYAKLEKNNSSAMWGDFVTDSNGIEGDVSRISRSLTGANVVLNKGKSRIQAYASRLEENHIVEEIAGKGIALNYQISYAPIVRNSEIVELVTYSKVNPGIVLSVEKLQRFSGYQLDDVIGELSFSDSIPSVDEQGNPVFIRVSYDVENGGEHYNVAGLRITKEINDKLILSGSYSYDDHIEKGNNIVGVAGQYTDKGLKIAASVAHMTHNNDNKKGSAVRIDIKKQWKKGKSSVTYARADAGFTNSAGGVTAGREEIRLQHSQKLRKNINLNAEVIQSKRLDNYQLQRSYGLNTDIKFKEWTLKSGVRHIDKKSDSENESFNTVVVGAKKTFKIAGQPGSFSTEYEQDIGKLDRKRLAITGDMKVHKNVSLYAKAEHTNNLTSTGGSDNTNTLSVGVKSKLSKSTDMYSEYRLRGVANGKDVESAVGVKGTYNLAKGLSLSPRLEIIKGHSGNATDSVATSVALEDKRNKHRRSRVRLEARHDNNRDYVGFEASHIGRLNEEWSLVGKDTLRIEKPNEGDYKYDNNLSLGLAKRSRLNNKHNMLFMYENKLKKGYNNEDCITQIMSTHQSIELKENLVLSGRLAGKQQKCNRDGNRSTSNAVIVDGRLVWDINNRWDADIHGGILGTDDMSEQQYSAGVGVNYLLRRNLRVGMGYNISGFEDKDLDSEGYNKEGLYMGLQYKFDELSLPWLSGESTNNK